MRTGIVIVLYSILLLWSVYSLTKQYNKNKIINASILFQLAFIIYYVLLPIMSFIVIEFYPNDLTGYLSRINTADTYDIIYALFYTFVAYFVIFLVYRIRFTTEQPILKGKVRVINNTNSPAEFDKKNRRAFRIAFNLGLITLIIGIIGELTVANSLGGILNAVTMGDKLRAFGNDMSMYLPQSKLFTVTLMVSSLSSTYLFVYALRIYKKFSVLFLLLLSIMASIFYLMINAGRLGILLFLITFFADFAIRKLRHPFIFMLVFSVIGIFMLGVLDDLFFYLSYGHVKESSTSISSILNEFAFPYLNILNVHHINEWYGLRWGVDYITWIINVIPSSILSTFGLSKVTTGYQFITEYYSGENAIGGTPTDILTLGIRQFGFFGVVIVSIIITICCKFFDKLLDKVHSMDYYFMTLRIALIMFIIVPYADLDSFIRNRYDMILILVFLVIISKFKKRKLLKG